MPFKTNTEANDNTHMHNKAFRPKFKREPQVNFSLFSRIIPFSSAIKATSQVAGYGLKTFEKKNF